MENFSDAHPPLDNHEAFVEADRCYFCYDAPCIQHVQHRLTFLNSFVKSPQAIWLGQQNDFRPEYSGWYALAFVPQRRFANKSVFGEVAEGKPVKIGLLQRHATDNAMSHNQFYERAASTGKKIAIVGAGPAGLPAPTVCRLMDMM